MNKWRGALAWMSEHKYIDYTRRGKAVLISITDYATSQDSTTYQAGREPAILGLADLPAPFVRLFKLWPDDRYVLKALLIWQKAILTGVTPKEIFDAAYEYTRRPPRKRGPTRLLYKWLRQNPWLDYKIKRPQPHGTMWNREEALSWLSTKLAALDPEGRESLLSKSLERLRVFGRNQSGQTIIDEAQEILADTPGDA